MTREELENKMAVLLGGRAAEQVTFGHFSTGAADDLAKATEIARSMVTQYGMVEELGHVAYDKQPHSYLGTPVEQTWLERRYSEETAREIDCAVRTIIQAAFERAVGILTANNDVLERTATALLETETLDEAALGALVADLKKAA